MPEHVPAYHAWLADPDLQATTCTEPLATLEEELAAQGEWTKATDRFIKIIAVHARDGSLRPIGDINLFRLEGDVWEVSLMIAEAEQRGKGFAREALRLMLDYYAEECRVAIAKVGHDNARSIAFFKACGFVSVSLAPDVFGNLEFKYTSEQLCCPSTMQVKPFHSCFYLLS